MRQRLSKIVCCTFTLVAVATSVHASITLTERHPTDGERIEMFVQDEAGAPVAGAAVSVTYRPGSSVESSEDIGTTNDAGRIGWTPSTAGIATLTATWDVDGEEYSTSENISVKFSAAPKSGIAIMILAGLLLVGGSAVRVARVVKAA